MDLQQVKQVVAVALIVVMGLRILHKAWRRMKYDWHKIPEPLSYPLVGHLPYYLHWNRPRVHLTYLDWVKENGKVVKTESLGLPKFLYVADPEYIQSNITGHGAHGLPKHEGYESFKKLTPGRIDSIFTCKDTSDYWKTIRKGTARAFSVQAISAMCPKIFQKATQLVQVIKATPSSQPIDFQPLMTRFTLDVIGSVGFGINFQALTDPHHPLLEGLKSCTVDVVASNLNPFRRLVKWVFPMGQFAQEAKKMYEQLHGQYRWIFNELKGRDPPREDDLSIWACLSRLQGPLTSQPISDDALITEMATFVNAGTETTAHQVMWALLCLACHPDAQQKLFTELKDSGMLERIQSGHLTDVTYTDLMSLKYLAMVVKESIRILPASANGAGRTVRTDGERVCGYRIPKGTRINVPIYAIHHAPWLWDQPELFRPERWSKEVGGQWNDPDVSEGSTGRIFWGFSYGPRDCIGQRMAMAEMHAVLATLVGSFEIKLADRMGGWEASLSRQYLSLVLCIEGGMWLHCYPRPAA